MHKHMWEKYICGLKGWLAGWLWKRGEAKEIKLNCLCGLKFDWCAVSRVQTIWKLVERLSRKLNVGNMGYGIWNIEMGVPELGCARLSEWLTVRQTSAGHSWNALKTTHNKKIEKQTAMLCKLIYGLWVIDVSNCWNTSKRKGNPIRGNCFKWQRGCLGKFTKIKRLN